MRFLTALLLCAAAVLGAAEPQRLTIQGGAKARENVLVTFNLSGAKPGSTWLACNEAVSWPIEVDPSGSAVLLIPKLDAGQTLQLNLQAIAPYSKFPLQAEPTATGFKLSAGDRQILAFNTGLTPLPAGYGPEFQRGGYLYPLFSPKGVLLLDDYPHNHKHHHGIWMAWTKTSFDGRAPDFWNMGQKIGTVVPVEGAGQSWSGTLSAGVITKNTYLDLKTAPPTAVLNETWVVRACKLGEVNIVDLEITQTCAGTAPLKLPKYHYGGIGIRGHGQWDGKGKTEFLSSEGIAGPEKGNETKARWCHMGGSVDGARAGLAIFCHPKNFRAPQPMRQHPTEPFFCYCPSQGGDWSIEPGTPYVMRYRIATYDGGPDKERLEQLWADYAEPPVITVE